jgi:alpha/beta superfamily hydrolase
MPGSPLIRRLAASNRELALIPWVYPTPLGSSQFPQWVAVGHGRNGWKADIAEQQADARCALAMSRLAFALLLVSMWLTYGPAHAQLPAPHDKSEIKVERDAFSADDGALIYAEVYGTGDRGVILAHGGQFTKESWKPQAEQLARAGFHVLAFDFRGFGQSHGPGDSDMFTAPMHLDVLAAVRFLRRSGAKTVAVVGASFGGSAAADASIASPPGEIDRLILLAAEGNGPAEKIKAPLLEIIARDDADDDGPRLPHIRAWFDKAPGPKKLIVLDGSAHAQFLFQTGHAGRVMKEIFRFLRSGPK